MRCVIPVEQTKIGGAFRVEVENEHEEPVDSRRSGQTCFCHNPMGAAQIFLNFCPGGGRTAIDVFQIVKSTAPRFPAFGYPERKCRPGGVRENVADLTDVRPQGFRCGIVVKREDVDGLEQAVFQIDPPSRGINCSEKGTESGADHREIGIFPACKVGVGGEIGLIQVAGTRFQIRLVAQLVCSHDLPPAGQHGFDGGGELKHGSRERIHSFPFRGGSHPDRHPVVVDQDGHAVPAGEIVTFLLVRGPAAGTSFLIFPGVPPADRLNTEPVENPEHRFHARFRIEIDSPEKISAAGVVRQREDAEPDSARRRKGEFEKASRECNCAGIAFPVRLKSEFRRREPFPGEIEQLPGEPSRRIFRVGVKLEERRLARRDEMLFHSCRYQLQWLGGVQKDGGENKQHTRCFFHVGTSSEMAVSRFLILLYLISGRLKIY